MHICGRIRFYTAIWIHPYNRECEGTERDGILTVPSVVVGYSRFSPERSDFTNILH